MKKSVVALLLSLLLLLAACAASASGGPEELTVTVTYGQTEARDMLVQINEFRGDTDATWYWDLDENKNEIKIYCEELEDLEYDYDLEKVAMQRAAEIAISFEHTRPNQMEFDQWAVEEFPNNCLDMGENIAAGQATAQAAFTSWREEDKDYKGQGHRRNMLGVEHTYNCIGIGHAIYNGVHFWTQELAYREAPNRTVTPAVDSETSVEIAVSPALVKSVSAVADLALEFGAQADLPSVTFVMNKTWPSSVTIPWTGTVSWASSDTSVLTVDGTKAVAKKKGSATLTATVLGQPVSSAVTVSPRDIAGASVAVEAGTWTYSGSAQTPGVTVTEGGVPLVRDTDYTVAYSNNTGATDAAGITVTGIGNYTGTAGAAFAIGRAPLTVKANDSTVVYGSAPAGNGVAYSGFVGGEDASVLSGEAAFTFSCSQYDKPGTYQITPSGLTSDNYRITFETGVLAITPKTVGLTWGETSLVYNGETQAPTVTVTGIVNDDAVTAAVTGGQTDAGEYTAAVTGLSGSRADCYQLPESRSVAFTIGKAPAVVTTAPTAKALVWTGSAQELVSAGTGTGGEMQYALGADDTTAPADGFTASVPSGTDVKDYFVWYKVVGDKNHTDTAAACVKASIVPAGYTVSFDPNGGTGTMEPVTVVEGQKFTLPACGFTAPENMAFDSWDKGVAGTVIDITADTVITAQWKKLMTVSAEDVSITYDGKAHGITVNVKDPADGAVIRYGKKAGEYNLSSSPTIKNAGAVTIYFRITADGYADYTGSAKVTVGRAKITKATITFKKKSVYTGKAQKPAPTVKLNGVTLKKGIDYTVSYENNKNAGTATATITGKGNFTGKISKSFKINQAKLTFKGFSPTKKTISFNSLKSNPYKFTLQTSTNAAKNHAATYQLTKKSKYVTVNKSGKVTVKKGTPKGTYTITLKITCKATENYKKAVFTKKFVITVK